MSGGDSLETKRYGRWWIFVFALLITVIIAGGVVLGIRHIGRSQGVELILPSDTISDVDVYLSGAVANEGIYTFSEDSSLGDILATAGITEKAEPVKLKLRVLYIDENPFEQPQEQLQDTRINVNTASAEELQTLPGIGPVKAQAIIDYRTEEGFFHTVDELTNVKGIGPITLEKIRDKVKVVD